MVLFNLALAPAVIGISYIYVRDKYEKEPYRLLLMGFIYGAIVAGIVISFGYFANRYEMGSEVKNLLYEALFKSAGIEELTKFIILYFLIWRNKNFNEPFDGIVYSVFISLGFANIENIIYVFNENLGGINTAFMRAVISVPGHGLFGVIMGYYIALAKFKNNSGYLLKAFILPWIYHSIYNLILLSGFKYYYIFFVPFVIYMWVSGFKKMKIHIENSPFKKICL